MEKGNWISRNYQKKKPAKFNTNFKRVQLRCDQAVMITIKSTKNLHRDMNENYDTPYLMTSRTSTDPLESEFNVIKGSIFFHSISRCHI